jgi:hypothetical protein
MAGNHAPLRHWDTALRDVDERATVDRHWGVERELRTDGDLDDSRKLASVPPPVETHSACVTGNKRACKRTGYDERVEGEAIHLSV